MEGLCKEHWEECAVNYAILSTTGDFVKTCTCLFKETVSYCGLHHKFKYPTHGQISNALDYRTVELKNIVDEQGREVTVQMRKRRPNEETMEGPMLRIQCKRARCTNQASRYRGLCIKHGGLIACCKREGCENKSVKQGFCLNHIDKTRPLCAFDGCINYAHKRGAGERAKYCCKHGGYVKICKGGGCTSQGKGCC